MKKFLAMSAVLVFLFVAGPVQADWVNDLPVPENVTAIGLKFTDGVGVATIKTGKSCMQYKIVENEIVKMRKCVDADWKDFVK